MGQRPLQFQSGLGVESDSEGSKFWLSCKLRNQGPDVSLEGESVGINDGGRIKESQSRSQGVRIDRIDMIKYICLGVDFEFALSTHASRYNYFDAIKPCLITQLLIVTCLTELLLGS